MKLSVSNINSVGIAKFWPSEVFSVLVAQAHCYCETREHVLISSEIFQQS